MSTLFPPEDAWVIDTSSLIMVKSATVPKVLRADILKMLDTLIERGTLVFPAEVVVELHNDDVLAGWARKNQNKACRFGPLFFQVKDLLLDAQIRRVIDTEKNGREEADPYILALALELRKTCQVTVVTEEKKDSPDKLSLSTACGLKKLPSIPFLAFLGQHGIILDGTGSLPAS